MTWEYLYEIIVSMTSGKTYKNINNTEVAFVVFLIRPISNNDSYQEVLGTWINIVDPENIYAIDAETIKIKIEDLGNWVEYDTN